VNLNLPIAFALFAATGAQGWAQQAGSPSPGQEAPAAPDAPRAVSPAVAVMLAAAMPKYAPPKTKAVKRAPTPPTEEAKPRNGIVHLSPYIVRGEKPPTDQDIMTKSGLEQWAMNTYLGSTHDFDRGVLNHTTLDQMWSKIPVIGKVPFFGSASNESRAMTHYYDEGLPGEIKVLSQLDALGGAAPVGPQLAVSPAPKP
jgi:hypothetical protein